jgi:hypothetical protein
LERNTGERRKGNKGMKGIRKGRQRVTDEDTKEIIPR